MPEVLLRQFMMVFVLPRLSSRKFNLRKPFLQTRLAWSQIKDDNFFASRALITTVGNKRINSMNRKSLVKAFRAFFLQYSLLFSAQAYEIGGVKVSEKPFLIITFFSSGDNNYPAAGGATNEQYRLSQAQVLFSKDIEDFSILGRSSYVPTEYLVPATNSRR